MHENIPEGISGLSSREVSDRLNSGYVNTVTSNTKSFKQIFKENLLTFFNILNLIFAVLIICTGTYSNLLFLIVVIFNLVIGIVQEISAKITLDRLSLLIESEVLVIRDNVQKNIKISELVKDDVIILNSGQQICADGVVVYGNAELNESLLTGESETVFKGIGSKVYSGSYLVSGQVYIKLTDVGNNSYSGILSKKAKKSKKLRSDLMLYINIILKTVSVIIVPLGLIIFLKQDFITGLPVSENIVKTVAALISMIPEGLVLLTSMALASSTIILSYKKTLVQNLYAAENLARTDTVCFDKTGTLTTGKLYVKKVIYINECSDLIENYVNYCKDNNSTFFAISDYFSKKDSLTPEYIQGFSSERKYSLVSFKNTGTIFVGAFDILFKNKLLTDFSIGSEISGRYVCVAYTDYIITENDCFVPENLSLKAIISFADSLNKDSSETIDYLTKQGIDIKVISGDSETSVAYVLDQLGFEYNILDMSKADENLDYKKATKKYNVFCRVLPYQKLKIIQAIRLSSHKVTMVGDGINDVPALKESDCSIAMANGSEVARNISDIVQLESDFSSVPSIFSEGRRVINNIQRVAALFTTKTIYSILISILTLIIPTFVYPFNPLQLTIISFLTIGFPAFFMSFEPNKNKIEGNFLSNVLKRSVPGAMSVFSIMIVLNIINIYYLFDYNNISTIAYIIISIIGLYTVLRISWPLSKLRLFVLLASISLLILSVIIKPVALFIGIEELSSEIWIIIAILSAAVPFLYLIFEKVFNKIINKISHFLKYSQKGLSKHIVNVISKK